jgi:hypothetical protein
MKTFLVIIISVLTGTVSFGQKYLTWVKTTGSKHFIKGDLEYFNDSVLVTSYRNPQAYTRFKQKELNFKWDDINALNIRNEDIHGTGIAIGIGVGIISSLIIAKSIQKNTTNIITGTFGLAFAAGGAVGVGMLAGHLLTSARIVIPLDGKTAKEKSQALKNQINRLP